MFKLLMTSALALAAASAAFAQSQMVSEVEVEVDLEAIESPEAAQYWTSIADDVENAIVARLTDRLAPEATEDSVRIAIDISEVELSSAFQNLLGAEDSRLAGRVAIWDATENSQLDSYDLSVTIDQVAVYLPEGADLSSVSTDSEEYYTAVTSAFADAVVARLQ